MKINTKGDLKIIGDSSASGGHYKNARIIGDSIVNGDIDCVNFKCVGNTKVDGKLHADNTKVVGSLSVIGSIESDDIRIDGNIESYGDLMSKNLVLRGGMDVKGGVTAEDIRLIGYTTIRKNCDAESFRSEGPLTIVGLLNADEIDIRINSRCKVAEIGGERIQARRGHYPRLGNLIKSFFIPADLFKGKLITDSIEGDEIRLEDTNAKIVRGKKIFIGDGCEIDIVEYAEECRITRRSSVKEKKKISAR